MKDKKQSMKNNWEKEFDKEFPRQSASPKQLEDWLWAEKQDIKSFILQLLAREEANWMAEIHEQVQEAEKRDRKTVPMGVSQWKKIGQKYKYDKYFNIRW